MLHDCHKTFLTSLHWQRGAESRALCQNPGYYLLKI